MDTAAARDDSFTLLGALSLDIYRGRDLVLPGGGVLNMAWHWRRSGTPFQLLSRVGDDHPGVFRTFLDRHAIPASPALVAPGASASIDIVIRPDRQPHMDNFVEGVWADFALTHAEERRLREGHRLHLVLVEGAIRELSRLKGAGALEGLEVSADFLGFRHYTLERLAETMRAVDVGFVGWPGTPDDDAVAGIRAVAHDLGRLIVVTFGAQGVCVFDGRVADGDAFIPVEPVPVAGTTVGCGDAFIAGFLAEWRLTADPPRAVAAGKALGAAATAWRRPLPDEAYGPEITDALRAVDRSA